MSWVDRYSGNPFRITTFGTTGGPGVARVQTYRDVLEEFRHHPEAKSADASGRPCSRQTLGLLGRRRVKSRPELLTYVGKEANKLEEVELGLEHDPDEIYTEYADPERDPRNLVVPLLQRCNLSELTESSGITGRQLRNLDSGKARPRDVTRQRLLETLRGMELDDEAAGLGNQRSATASGRHAV